VVHPDWTLNRNNGDLQLLKDAVLHSSAVYPNYNTSYTKATHLLTLFRDSVEVDTTPLPSYVLLKPEDDEIHLVRDGTETDSIVEDKFFTYRLQEDGSNHELTEDASVVSTVTDDTSEAADVTIWHEKEWVFADQSGDFTDRFQLISGFGTWVANDGYNSEWDVGAATQKLRVIFTPSDREAIFKLRLKVVSSSTVASGTLKITHDYLATTIQLGGDEDFNGVEERVIERVIEFKYNNAEAITFNYIEEGAVSDGLFRITEIALQMLGYPLAPEDALTTNQVIHNKIDESFSI
jgi:hypothetical protein